MDGRAAPLPPILGTPLHEFPPPAGSRPGWRVDCWRVGWRGSGSGHRLRLGGSVAPAGWVGAQAAHDQLPTMIKIVNII